MKKIIMLVILAVLVGCVGLYLFKRDMFMELYESNLRGYGIAKTPQECVDRFNKAIKERNYKMAAKYVDKDFAEQLIKAHEAGKEVGAAIDDLTYRMEKDGVMTKEVEAILFLNDPLPKNADLKISATTDSTATAVFTIPLPSYDHARAGQWDVDLLFINGFYKDQLLNVPLAKDSNGAWKVGFVASPAARARFDRVVTVYKDYVNAFKKMSDEVRTERTTKEDVSKRLKELLTEAVRNKR